MLNEPAGHIAQIIVVSPDFSFVLNHSINPFQIHAAPLVIKMWDNTGMNANEAIEDILQCLSVALTLIVSHG